MLPQLDHAGPLPFVLDRKTGDFLSRSTRSSSVACGEERAGGQVVLATAGKIQGFMTAPRPIMTASAG